MPDRPSSTDVARVRERLEDRADSTEALDSAVGVAYNEGLIRDLREAASLLADYEARGEALARISEEQIVDLNRSDPTDLAYVIRDRLLRVLSIARAHTPTDTDV